MYDAVQSGDSHMGKHSNLLLERPIFNDFHLPARIYDVPTESKEPEPASAIIAPSSITHRTSPQLQIRKPRELNPTSVDTGKDTQSLVEEDKSEC
jgi:low density lipoprotein-related protein 2